MSNDLSGEARYHKDGAPDCQIKLYMGGTINVLYPKQEDFNIFDIAHALSCQGRFSGHTYNFYSVAQHSTILSRQLPKPLQLIGLLHDATEAYLVDMPRPIKQATSMGERYREIEDNLYTSIAYKWGLPNVIPHEVKLADSRMLCTEMRDLMGGVYGSFTQDAAPYDTFSIVPESPNYAEKSFLKRYLELNKINVTDEDRRQISLKIFDEAAWYKERDKKNATD